MPCHLLVFWTSQRAFDAQGLLGVSGSGVFAARVGGMMAARAPGLLAVGQTERQRCLFLRLKLTVE